MKLLLSLTFLIYVSSFPVFGQVGLDNTSPDPSSVLDLSSTEGGLLVPRMTTQQREAIMSPANSLLVFDTSENRYFYYDQNRWNPVSPWSASASGSDIYYEAGNVGIGTASPQYTLDVNGSVNVTALHINGTPLPAEIFPLSNGALAKTATGDWNDYTETGLYAGNGLSNQQPFITGTHGWKYVMVIKHSESNIIQYSTDLNNRASYTRVKVGGTWEGWKRVNGIYYGTSSGDASEAILDGIYNGRPFSANHPPNAGHGRMFVFGENAAGLGQLFLDDYGKAYFRAQSWSDIWSDWKRVATMSTSDESMIMKKIRYNSFIEMLTVSGSAQRVATGGLFTGSSYSNIGLVPQYGIYSQDLIVTGKTLIENSDIRLKDNIEPIENALAKVLRIEGVTYTRKDLPTNERRHMGVVADDLLQIVPELVYVPENDEEMKSVSYSNMVALLVEAIKEQQTQAEELKQQIEKLKQEIEYLKGE